MKLLRRYARDKARLIRKESWSYGMQKWRLAIELLRSSRIVKAVEHLESNLRDRALFRWRLFVVKKDQKRLKRVQAEALQDRVLLRKCFGGIKFMGHALLKVKETMADLAYRRGSLRLSLSCFSKCVQEARRLFDDKCLAADELHLTHLWHQRTISFHVWVMSIEDLIRSREEEAEADTFRRFHAFRKAFSAWERKSMEKSTTQLMKQSPKGVTTLKKALNTRQNKIQEEKESHRDIAKKRRIPVDHPIRNAAFAKTVSKSKAVKRVSFANMDPLTNGAPVRSVRESRHEASGSARKKMVPKVPLQVSKTSNRVAKTNPAMTKQQNQVLKAACKQKLLSKKSTRDNTITSKLRTKRATMSCTSKPPPSLGDPLGLLKG